MLKTLNFKTLLLFFLLFFSFASFAQHKNFSILKAEPSWLQKVSTVDKRPANRDIQDGYYLFLYEQQNNIETKEHYLHAIREIVSDNGVQNGSEISVTYDPTYQKLTFHKITIWRNNQPINKLIASNFKVIQNEKELSKFIYSGTYSAYLILDDVRKGDRIEYAYTIKGENPVFYNKYSNTFYFEGGSQISNVYVNLIAKKDRAIQIKNFNTVPSLKTKETADLKIYEWQEKQTKTIKSDDFEPSWYDPYSRVQVSEFKSWREIVDWSINLNNYDLKNSTILNNKIKELKEKAKGNLDKYFELATRFVQDEVRYMGIEMGEYSHRPNSPEKVLKQRYGDCKDKSLLLIYLLKGNGINAYPVYINTYLKDKSNELLPTTGAFNHAVVLVEYNGNKIYIDPTISDQRGPIKNIYFPYSANVLVVKPGNDRLEWVKANPKGKLSTTSLLKLPDTLEGNKAELIIKSTYSANYADDLRSEISSAGSDKLEKDYLEYYTKIYPGIATVKDLQIVDDEQNNIISLTETYDIENIWVKDDSVSNKYDVYLYADMIYNDLRNINKARKSPFALKYPSNIHQVIKVVLPEKWSINEEELNIERANYKFNFSLKYNTDTVTLDYTYQNKNYEIPGDETKQYIKDRKTITSAINYNIYYNGLYEGNNADSDINGILIVISFVVLIFSGCIGAFLYFRKQPFDLEKIKNAKSINGWLILVAIGVIITPITISISTYSSEIFSDKVWRGLANLSNTQELLLKGASIFECIFNTLLIAFSILIAILFFNRRSVLPKYYIIFRLFNLFVLIVDIIILLYINSKTPLDIDFHKEIMSIIFQIIISAVWITYFIKSERVKETFVFTYPANAWRWELIKEQGNAINIPFPGRLEPNQQEQEQRI